MEMIGSELLVGAQHAAPKLNAHKAKQLTGKSVEGGFETLPYESRWKP